jgi:hypothetical protein
LALAFDCAEGIDDERVEVVVESIEVVPDDEVP